MEKREFLSYFNEKYFIPELKSNTKDEVLKEIVDRIAEHFPLKDTQLILDMLKRREQLGSTGIGKGIAIPHGRSLSVPNLIIAFGKSSEGLEFDSIDNEPIYFIFMIIAPPQDRSNIYLPFLGKLVEILNQENVRKKLQNSKTYKDFIKALSGGFNG